MQLSHRYMSVGRTFCYCKGILQVVREEILKQIIQHVIQNIDFLTESAFKIKKGYRVETRMVKAKKHKTIGKARDAMKSVKEKGYGAILARYNDDDTPLWKNDCTRIE